MSVSGLGIHHDLSSRLSDAPDGEEIAVAVDHPGGSNPAGLARLIEDRKADLAAALQAWAEIDDWARLEVLDEAAMQAAPPDPDEMTLEAGRRLYAEINVGARVGAVPAATSLSRAFRADSGSDLGRPPGRSGSAGARSVISSVSAGHAS